MIRMIKSFISFWLTSLALVGIIVLFFFIIGAPALTSLNPHTFTSEIENANTIRFYLGFIIIFLGISLYFIKKLLKISNNIFGLIASIAFVFYFFYLDDSSGGLFSNQVPFFGFDFNNYLMPIIVLCSSLIFVILSNLSYLNFIKLNNFLKNFLSTFTPLVFGIFLIFSYILLIKDYSFFLNTTSNHFFKRDYFNNKEVITCRLLYDKKEGYSENYNLGKIEVFKNKNDYVANIEKFRNEWKESGYSGEFDDILNKKVYLKYDLFSSHDFITHIYIVYEPTFTQRYEYKIKRQDRYAKKSEKIIKAKS